MASAEGQVPYAIDFMYHAGNDPERMILLGRLPMMLMTVLGALLVYLLARTLFGTAEALFALALTAVSPVVLAYGRLITFDMSCATFILATLLCYWRYLQRPRAGRLLLTAACLAAALLSQDTGLLLLPVLAALAVAEGARGTRGGRGLKWRRIRGNLLKAAAIGLAALTMITVFYGLHSAHMPAEKVRQTLRANVPAGSTGDVLVRGLERVSPPLALYASSVSRNFYLNRDYQTMAYLNGRAQWGPFWYFWPEVFFLKTQLGVLALLLLALLLYPWRRLRLQDAFVLVPLAVFTPFFLTMRTQFGAKYLIPLYLVLYLFIARGCLEACRRARDARRRSALPALVGTLLLFAAASTLSALPYIIPYFNLSIGSRDNGYKYLVDNNLDWGQDLKRLAAFAEAEGIDGLRLFYFGSADSSHYIPGSIDMWPQPTVDPGWLAVSATARERLLLEEPGLVELLDRNHPYAVVGRSILVYRLEGDWTNR